MATWNQLFQKEEYIAKAPEGEVLRFINLLKKRMNVEHPRIWDLCCGAGRHTVSMASAGCQVYGTDDAPNGIEFAKNWLKNASLEADLKVADMTVCPWDDIQFDGVVCWDAINHNTRKNIEKTIDLVKSKLVPGGFFLATLKSTKADRFGAGKRIEPNTFVQGAGAEEGVPHFYFDEDTIREMFKEWEIMVLCEQVIKNYENLHDFYKYSPFRHTTWGALFRKPL